MIEGLAGYPAYKESGLAWLGRVPGHWAMEPGLALFREAQEKNSGMREKRVLSLSYGRVVVKPVDKLHGLVPESFETYQIVNPGDLVIRGTDLQNDWTSLRVGIVRDRGIITSAYLSLKCRGLLQPEFAYQVLHAYDLRKFFYGLGSGLRQNLSFDDFRRLPFPVPPPDEQAAIVRFLDHANRRIDQFIRAKRKLIALLNEQKQAIIQHALGRGLQSSVETVDTGLDWLGHVPRKWTVMRLKYLLREVDVRSTTGSETLLSVRMYHGIVPFAEHFSRPAQAATLAGFKIVEPGQIVVNRMQAGNGLIFASTRHGLVSPDYAVLSASPDIDVNYLSALLRTPRMRTKLRSESKGLGTGTSGFLRLYTDRLGALPIALPTLTEQREIISSIDRLVGPIVAAVEAAERQITLLREYRTRLISDVVTGQLDVRAAAATLPADLPPAAEEVDLDDEAELDEDTEGDEEVA